MASFLTQVPRRLVDLVDEDHAAARAHEGLAQGLQLDVGAGIGGLLAGALAELGVAEAPQSVVAVQKVAEDWTEDGIATDLIREGVPKEDIVLAFQPPEMRPYTEFAAA